MGLIKKIIVALWTGFVGLCKLTKERPKIMVPVLLVLLFMGWWVKPYFWATWTGPATVTSTQGEAGEGNYIVFVEYADGSKESIQNVDCWWRFKINSTDIQAEMKGAEGKDKTYRFKVLGRRLHIWSSYRNMLTYERE
tara:strand:+ start:224 stop:637 length:414 start_codon:yes stop_codon:yes gene_type:complete